jgi:hypothetical protein
MADIHSRPSGVDVTNPAIAAMWEKVRSDTDPTNWLLLHCPSKTEIVLKHSGDTGLAGLLQKLDTDSCLYGAIRVNARGMIKFYSLYCAGENVSAVQKGKNALYKNGVLMCLDGLHGELTFPEGTATTVDAIMAQLVKLSGVPKEDIVA